MGSELSLLFRSPRPRCRGRVHSRLIRSNRVALSTAAQRRSSFQLLSGAAACGRGHTCRRACPDISAGTGVATVAPVGHVAISRSRPFRRGFHATVRVVDVRAVTAAGATVATALAAVPTVRPTIACFRQSVARVATYTYPRSGALCHACEWVAVWGSAPPVTVVGDGVDALPLFSLLSLFPKGVERRAFQKELACRCVLPPKGGSGPLRLGGPRWSEAELRILLERRPYHARELACRGIGRVITWFVKDHF